MQRYTDSEVKDLAASMNGNVEEIVNQHQLEFSRLGRNEMRLDPTMGAIRVASIRFPDCARSVVDFLRSTARVFSDNMAPVYCTGTMLFGL